MTKNKTYELLFTIGVVLYFFILPIHTDPSAVIIPTTLFGILAVYYKPVGLTEIFNGPAKAGAIAFLLFIVTAFAASVCSPKTFASFPHVLVWACCITSGILFAHIRPEQTFSGYYATLATIIGSFIMAMVLYPWGDSAVWHEFRLKLFAIHPSRLAIYCSACLFFCLHASFSAKDKKQSVIMLGLALFMLWLIYLTNTRAILLMLPIGIASFIVILPKRYRMKIFLFFAMVCFALAGTAYLTQSTKISSRIISATINPTHDSTFRSRLPIWEAGWESFKKAPLIGNGIRSYRELHKQYLAEHKEEWDIRYEGFYEHSVKQAHNLVLGRMVETGTIGTFFFFTFYLCCLYAAFKGTPKSRWVLSLLVFYLGMGMMDDTLFRLNDSFVLFTGGAALGCWSYAHRSNRSTGPVNL